MDRSECKQALLENYQGINADKILDAVDFFSEHCYDTKMTIAEVFITIELIVEKHKQFGEEHVKGFIRL